MMESSRTRVSLIGLGAIGQSVVELIDQHASECVEVVGALVRNQSRSREVVGPETTTTLDGLLSKRPDVVVEVAGHGALRDHGPQVLRSGYDLIVVSAGVLADPLVYDALLAAAEAGGGRIKVASGAIGALDAIGAASVGGLTRVVHTTRKPAKTLLGNKGDQLTKGKELFRGSAREAVLRFPESTNVAAAVSLAGFGMDLTEVRVVADPYILHNRHEVVAEGAFGSLRFDIENAPSERNPKTAQLVAMSIVRTLLLRRAPITIG